MRAVMVGALIYAAAACTVFCIVYHVLYRWWERAIGVNLMLLALSMAATFDIWIAFIFVPHRPEWLRWVAAVFFISLGTIMWWRLALAVRERRPASDPRP